MAEPLLRKMMELHRCGALHPTIDSDGKIQRIETIGQLEAWILQCECSYLKRCIAEQRQKNAEMQGLLMQRRG